MSKAHLSAISQLTQSQGMAASSLVVPTRPRYLSLYQHTFLLAALSGSIHKNQSTAKQRPQGSTDIPLALPKKHILYFSILQGPCWETNYRSKRWLCLTAFPGKTLQLGQLRPSLITAYSISGRSLAAHTAEHSAMASTCSRAACPTGSGVGHLFLGCSGHCFRYP